MTYNYKILVADDDHGTCQLLSYALSSEYDVTTVSEGRDVLKILSEQTFDILLLDLSFPDMDGIEILEKINKSKIKINTIVISASGDIEKAITTMKLGSYDYVIKPINLERIKLIIKNLTDKLNLETEIVELREKLRDGFRFSSMVASSPAMKHIFEMLSKVINTDVTLLIMGESGTGKGVLANAIHYNSNRAQFPFRTLDCSTIPRELIESELFGHEKGAFTGASSRKPGKFEVASNGTLFIDEISNLSLEVQAKLLKVLQEKQFERIGGCEVIKVDTRIIAASNRDLKQMVKDGTFREDLYYRLNIFPVNIPLLKERGEDISLLISHFVMKFNAEYSKNASLEKSAEELLNSYSWPGNVRQLENIIRRAVILSEDAPVKEEEILPLLEHDIKNKTSLNQPIVESKKTELAKKHDVRIKKLEDIEKDAICRAIEDSNYNLSLAAKELGISRKTIHNKINRYGLVIEKKINL